MNSDQDRVERLVQSVLAVDPSSQFEARIRNRVRQEAIERHAGLQGAVMLSGFIAAVTLVFMLASLKRETLPRTESVSTAMGSEAPTSDAPIVIKEPRKPQALRRNERKIPDVVPADVAAVSGSVDVLPDSPLMTESLPRPRLNEFVLGTSSEPLTVRAVAAPQALPLFEIRQFSLLSSNEGVAE
jgi:hypothetical protein